MKNIVLFLGAILLLASCSSSPEGQLLGKWKMTNIKITRSDGQEIPEANRGKIADFEKKLVEDGTTYEFKDGGKFDKVSKDGKVSGTYTAIEDKENEGGLLVALITEEDGESTDATKLTITSISDKEFTTVSDDGEIKITSTYSKQ